MQVRLHKGTGHSPCQCYIPRFDPVCSGCGWAPTKGPAIGPTWHRLERSLVSAIHIYEAGTVVFAPTHSAQLCVGKILTLGLGQLGSKCPLSMPRLVSPRLLCSNAPSRWARDCLSNQQRGKTWRVDFLRWRNCFWRCHAR